MRPSSEAEIARAHFACSMAELCFNLPGTVLAFDPATQLATVRPDLMRPEWDAEGKRTAAALPVLSHVPVHFPRGGGFSITMPVKAGDSCLLVFIDASIDTWLSKGGLTDPQSFHAHDLSDAVAFVGVFSQKDKLKNFDADCISIGREGAAADYVALAAKVDALLADIKTLFTSWTPVRMDGGAVLKALATSTFAKPAWLLTVGSRALKVRG